ncbi:hypothetical protein LguiA_021899 [Lonicera macranthoides]
MRKNCKERIGNGDSWRRILSLPSEQRNGDGESVVDATECIVQDKNAEASIERIRERFGKTDLSISSYDTAWVAMVPPNRDSQNHNHHQPSFPDCLEWVMENQKADGSWGLDLSHPSLVKDSLSSTLACVLALQKWKVGENLVQKGLGESYDWKEVIKSEQRSNGSLFNSPAATAASLISLHDDKCFDYLDSLLKIHGKADAGSRGTKRYFWTLPVVSWHFNY